LGLHGIGLFLEGTITVRIECKISADGSLDPKSSLEQTIEDSYL